MRTPLFFCSLYRRHPLQTDMILNIQIISLCPLSMPALHRPPSPTSMSRSQLNHQYDTDQRNLYHPAAEKKPSPSRSAHSSSPSYHEESPTTRTLDERKQSDPDRLSRREPGDVGNQPVSSGTTLSLHIVLPLVFSFFFCGTVSDEFQPLFLFEAIRTALRMWCSLKWMVRANGHLFASSLCQCRWTTLRCLQPLSLSLPLSL